MPRLALDDVELQLADSREAAFTHADWLFELKLDGFRLLAERVGGRVRLQYRRGKDVTALWPEIVEALEALPAGDFILDGELVIQDPQGRPVFQRLLKRSMLAKAKDVKHAAATDPAVLFVFDVLSAGEADLRSSPLIERKVTLASVMKGAQGRVRPLDWVDTQGEALLAAVKAQGLEGIVAKKKTSRYVAGRSSDWLKVALMQGGDFAVVGFAEALGSLHLATWNGAEFVYACKVGLTPAVARQLKTQLVGSVCEKPQCVGAIPPEADARWVEPTLAIEVRFKQWFEGVAPREPVLVRVRDDKHAKDCESPQWLKKAAPPQAVAAPVSKLKNAQKLFYPDDGITKADVVAYYRAVAPLMLVHLKDRPLLMERYPDGITGKSFFQRNLMAGAPKSVRVVHIQSDSENRELDQLVCDSADILEWCVTQAALVFHVPSTRVSNPTGADWAVIDFDPKGAPFSHVLQLAQGLHQVCDEVGLCHVVKTSGSSGLHVFVATHQQLDDAGAQSLAQLLAVVLVNRFPLIATTERNLQERKGRVYVDALQNYGGKTIAAPFTLRARPGAPVSMPLEWSMVATLKSAQDFTLRNALQHLEKHGDLQAKVFTAAPVPLLPVFEKLQTLALESAAPRR